MKATTMLSRPRQDYDFKRLNYLFPEPDRSLTSCKILKIVPKKMDLIDQNFWKFCIFDSSILIQRTIQLWEIPSTEYYVCIYLYLHIFWVPMLLKQTSVIKNNMKTKFSELDTSGSQNLDHKNVINQKPVLLSFLKKRGINNFI